MTLAVLRAGAAAIAVFAGAAASAQQPPLPPSLNPDRINEGVRRQFETPLVPGREAEADLAVDVAPPPGSEQSESDVRFTLRAVTFDDSAYLTKAELEAAAAEFVGRSIGIADLQQLVTRLNGLYAARGLATARAVLPAQDIADGTVRVRLVEGRLSEIGVTGGSAAGQAYVRDVVGLGSGDLADPRAIERALRRFNRAQDGRLRAALKAGSGLGASDLQLELTEPRRIQADLFADNNGYASTGIWQVGAVLRGYRLLTPADRIAAVLVRSSGVQSVSLSYSLPVGPDLRVGVSGSHGETEVSPSPSAPFDIRGRSYTLGLDVSAPLFIGSTLAVSSQASVQGIFSDTRIAGTKVIDNYALSAEAGLAADYTVARFAASARAQLLAVRVRERVSGTLRSPLIARADFQTTTALPLPVWLLRFRGEGQWTAADQLPGLLQYQIGGARSVRAYAPGFAAADTGYAVAAELGRTFDKAPGTLELFAFVDAARAGPAAKAVGGGLGFALGYGANFSLRGHLAQGFGGPGSPTRGYLSVLARF